MSTHAEGPQIRVAVVDNEPVAREGVVHALESAFRVEVIESARVYPGLVARLQEMGPDVIVADIDVTNPNEAGCLTALREACPESPVIVFTDEHQRESVLQAIVLGASGYVLKTAEKEELCKAVQAALTGRSFGGLELTPRMMWELVSHVREMKNHPRPAGLSRREHEILLLMIQGYTTEEIAGELFLSVHTVRTYRQRMMQKLGTRNRTELVVYALSHGLVDMPGGNGNRPGIGSPAPARNRWPE